MKRLEGKTAVCPLISPSLATAGATANDAAAQYLFQKYRETKSANTLKRHGYDLRLFSDYLLAADVVPHKRPFATEPEAWTGVTWGLIEGFVAWQIQGVFHRLHQCTALDGEKLCRVGGESGEHRSPRRDTDWRGQRLFAQRGVEPG